MEARRRHARGAIALAGLIAVTTGCGGERQDEDEPEGEFPVEVVSASFPERQRLAQSSNLVEDTFNGLLVDYARRRRASAIVRGVRAVSDFELEFQMALMNRHLEPTLETVFMMPAEQYTYLSSRLIKEVFSLGGDVRGLVPPAVERWMRRKKETVTS